MTDTAETKAAAYEAWLTSAERQRLREIADQASEIEARRLKLTRERKKIVDRAGARRALHNKREQGLQLRWVKPDAAEQKVDSAGAAK